MKGTNKLGAEENVENFSVPITKVDVGLKRPITEASSDSIPTFKPFKSSKEDDGAKIAENEKEASKSCTSLSSSSSTAAWMTNRDDISAGMNLFGRDDLVLNVGECDYAGGDFEGFHSGVCHPEI